MVDTRDVVAVVAVTLTEPGHTGAHHDVAGPEALSYAGVAAKLTSVLARPITYVDAPDDAVRQALLGAGLSQWFASALVGLYQDYRRSGTDGYAAQVTGTIQRLRAPGALTSEHVVWDVLRRLAPHLLTYLMSFLTLGIFWVGQQTQLTQFARSNGDLTWIHLAFLLGVALMPFSTMLLADYITYRLAVAVYWLNIVLLGALLYAGARYARRAKLIKQEVTAEMTAASERRIIAYQALYALGALLSVFSTYLSIAFIFAVQLNAAITPRIWRLDRF